MTKKELLRRQQQAARLVSLGLSEDQAETLRRASRTLSRWGELECGDGNEHASWAIERDEATGKPYFVTYPHDGKPRRSPIPDREKGALRRIALVCRAAGLCWHHQTDPRGAALYVAKEPLTDSNYSSRGIAVF